MPNLIKKIQNDANLNDLWKNDSKIVLGVSGGPDSACLLDVLAKISQKYEIKLHLVHVNYGLRGEDSQKDEELVQILAQKYQIGLSVLELGRLKKNEINEENLRNIRYDFFEKVREELKFDLIAVGHNQDDQVETFLMRVIRGAGLQGLSGMKFKSGKIIRPLLGISKKEVLGYLKNNELKFRIDKTNKGEMFFRNRVRNKLIPFLEKNFNPGIKKTIADSMIGIAEDLTLIDELAQENYARNKKLDAKEILKLNTALQRRIILEKIKEVKGNLKNIELSHVNEALKIIKSEKKKSQVFIFQGLKLMRKGDKLNLIKL